jgi:signal transduction histidine kinase
MEDSVDPALSHESLIHDFNNVFETITEAAELLKGDKRWRPLAATIIRSVTRGKRLLGAIPARKPMLGAILDDAIQSTVDYCSAARRPRLQFSRDVAPNLCLPGSNKDWERVFANLFLNSLQALHKPGRINVTAREAEGRLTISISDNGPGIPSEILPHMFQPNVSSKGSDARSGLGLHIVATIVRRYSGRISAANNDRRSGATFTIELPALR